MNHEIEQKLLQQVTRRHFFSQCGVGIGSLALSQLMGTSASAAPQAQHFPPRAKNVIFLFMAGGPSQLELFDYKPALQKYSGQPIPDSYMEGRRFAFMDTFFKEKPNLLGTVREFAQHGQSGAWVSELFPHIAKVVDDIAFIKTIATDVPNHAPAKLAMNTGSSQFGRPSMGSWVSYGLGSETSDLPGFVVLQSGPRGPRGGAVNWASGFLPASHQGVPFRTQGDPILNLSTPEGITEEEQRQVVDAVNALNEEHLEATGDPEIAARIAAYEMAYRMQTSAPELMDIQSESQSTLDMYGVDPDQGSYGRNCLLARRMIERGVRFVQLYHTNWDHHGGASENLTTSLEGVCHDVDQASAALVKDLQQRGLLDDTLVIWGGEFGRTPMGESRDTVGRNHHNECSTMWMAGGGIKPGFTLGETDELGFGPIADPVHVHDIHATILHLLGIDHLRLTHRFEGRDYRLTDLYGNVLHDLFV
jgi:hypothetical protein